MRQQGKTDFVFEVVDLAADAGRDTSSFDAARETFSSSATATK